MTLESLGVKGRRGRGWGGGYGAWRGTVERALTTLYRGCWPAHLWDLPSRAVGLREVNHTRSLPPGPGSRCRLAFVSDLHIGPTTPVALVQRAFEAVRLACPDVLLLGGDYVLLEATPRKLDLLEDMVRSAGCPEAYAVMGNHDLWTHDHHIVAALERAGARVLLNEAVRLAGAWCDVEILGLDDPWTGTCDATAALAQSDGAGFRIVVCHSPDGLLAVEGSHFDVFLCGHTHGGQVATPWGPIVMSKGALCRRYPHGVGRFNGGDVLVSRGVGAGEIPVRLFAPPDILVVDLLRPTADGGDRQQAGARDA
jgi:predicted MPP superfamily phosphohydrolase